MPSFGFRIFLESGLRFEIGVEMMTWFYTVPLQLGSSVERPFLFSVTFFSIYSKFLCVKKDTFLART